VLRIPARRRPAPQQLLAHRSLFLLRIIARQPDGTVGRKPAIDFARCELKTFIGPIGGHTFHYCGLGRRRHATLDIGRNPHGIGSQCRHHFLIPDPMQIAAAAAFNHGDAIAALVMAIRGMKRLVKIRYEMYQETECLQPRGTRRTRIAQKADIALDLTHHAIVARAIAAPVIAPGADFDIHIMPAGGLRPVVAHLVGPVGIQHHQRQGIAAQNLRDAHARGRRQIIGGDPCRDLMALRPPCLGGRRNRQQKGQQESQGQAHDSAVAGCGLFVSTANSKGIS